MTSGTPNGRPTSKTTWPADEADGAPAVIVVLSGPSARIRANSLGLAMSLTLGSQGESLLFVDADISGSRLAERYGEATRHEFSPVERGLPSIMVARSDLDAALLTQHCYSLDVEVGSLWALFGPASSKGGRVAARWLGERARELEGIDRDRTVVLAAPLLISGSPLEPLLKSAYVVVVTASIASESDARLLGRECRAAGMLGFERYQRLLVVEEPCPYSDDEVFELAGLRVAHRLKAIEDMTLLRRQGSRRDKATLSGIDELATRLSALREMCIADATGGDNEVTAAAAARTGGRSSPGEPESGPQAPQQPLDAAVAPIAATGGRA
ncbi:MAG: hypothetical protein OXM54_01020 [Acidimicrobiaceae bacterium]|nr:hypothetical protein [Acidimicrobiaceae bacterium]